MTLCCTAGPGRPPAMVYEVVAGLKPATSFRPLYLGISSYLCDTFGTTHQPPKIVIGAVACLDTGTTASKTDHLFSELLRGFAKLYEANKNAAGDSKTIYAHIQGAFWEKGPLGHPQNAFSD